jgi:hypothetical protein
MRDTPRIFVGTVTLRLEKVPCPQEWERVRAEVDALAGVRVRELDPAGGTVTVTADQPTDRSAVVGILERAGCAVLE